MSNFNDSTFSSKRRISSCSRYDSARITSRLDSADAICFVVQGDVEQVASQSPKDLAKLIDQISGLVPCPLFLSTLPRDLKLTLPHCQISRPQRRIRQVCSRTSESYRFLSRPTFTTKRSQQRSETIQAHVYRSDEIPQLAKRPRECDQSSNRLEVVPS